MSSTVLITGAGGFIGFRILLAALQAGHNVRYTVRSEENAQIVASNPAVQKLEPETRHLLSPVIIPDFTVDNAFDSALQGVTHIIHTGSLVPIPTYDPKSQIFEPTVKVSENILNSALKAPTVQRVIITPSIVATLGFIAASEAVSGSTRVPPPEPLPTNFDSVSEGYILGKILEIYNKDTFVKTKNPHFAVSHVLPGYVFGRNELALDAEMMKTGNGSNNFLMLGMLGRELPFPIHGGAVHIDDVADIHLRVAFDDACAGMDFAIATKVDYSTIFGIVAERYPDAVAAEIFKKGTVPTLPIEYNLSAAEDLLGQGKPRSFESAVVDVASQYLEKLGKEKETSWCRNPVLWWQELLWGAAPGKAS